LGHPAYNLNFLTLYLGLVRVQRGRPSDKADKESGDGERVPSIHIDDEADAREEMTNEELSEERRTFQISGVEDPESGDMIPLNEAIEKGKNSASYSRRDRI